MAHTDTTEAAAQAPAAAAATAPVLGFTVLCVQKAVEFNVTDQKLHRAAKDKELHEELEKLTDAGPSTFLYQLGGGCRIVGSSGSGGAPMSSACVGDSVAAFQGSLGNLAELAEMYVPEPQAGPGKATPAEVVCHMYLKVGVELLAKLRGRFAFCMYESKQGRVLAARDGSGAVHLYQGHSPAEGLVVSSSRSTLRTCSDIRAFAPGDFKYGWHSEPRQFSPMEFGRRSSHASGGPRRGSIDHVTGGRRSIDQSNMNHAAATTGGGSRRNSIDANASAHAVHSLKALQAANDSNSSSGSAGRWDAPNNKRSDSCSSDDSTGSGDKQQPSKPSSARKQQHPRVSPTSPLASQMKGMTVGSSNGAASAAAATQSPAPKFNVNAPEFRPTWTTPNKVEAPTAQA